MSTTYVLQTNILRNGNILDAIARKSDKVELLGSDGHTATCKRLINGETFTCDMANLKPDTSDSFLENELDLK